jgi:hypothetical protein
MCEWHTHNATKPDCVRLPRLEYGDAPDQSPPYFSLLNRKVNRIRRDAAGTHLNRDIATARQRSWQQHVHLIESDESSLRTGKLHWRIRTPYGYLNGTRIYQSETSAEEKQVREV